MKNLDAKTIPLHGRHIIEASAGTGKTFNITEIYVRLLLEKRLLPSQILVMTFTKDATQEIIGRVEKKLRDVLAKHKSNEETLSDDDYKHLKRSLLEIDEASIFTIHGFCKKVLSEQAFASGIEMDISMEADTSDILQKVVEDFFRKNINKNKQAFELLKAYSLHTPEKFLGKDGLTNVVKSNYKILAEKTLSLDDINIQKHNQLNIFESNEYIVDDFLSKLGKGEPEGKRVEEYHKILEWLNLKDEIAFPADISIITNGNKTKGAKVKPIFIGIQNLKDLFVENEQRKAAQFIQKTCLDVRQKFIQAKEHKGVLDFNDLITKLCQSVKTSPDLVKTLQNQYPVALIDEFQDTDAEQYQILDTIYPNENSSHSHEGGSLLNSEQDSKDTRLREYDGKLLLLMIGDPKQAIYGFRGGDIFTYLEAKKSCPAENQWSMDTNWRSTSEMIRAYNRLFYKKDYQEEGVVGKDIFSKDIHYQTVKASEKADEKRRDFGDKLEQINYFYYDIADDGKKNDIDKKLSNWTANEIARLLNNKKVQEKDIAILVENRTQASAVQKELNAKGLSSVYLSQRDNVYHSQEANEILFLMEGINSLENKSALKKALATSLMGKVSTDFISYQDNENVDAWDSELENAKELRNTWQKYGFMALIMKIIHKNFKQRSDNKERAITNILHLAELIKVAENKYKHPNQLIKWYRQQLKNDNNTEGELRLESDDNLIKIITIHGSKGLEYPIVFVPFASAVSTKKLQSKKINKYYDIKLKQTVYKVGKDADVKEIMNKETIEELMRLFYVAITRAESRCYIGVAKYGSCEQSPLAKFLDYKEKDDWLEKVQEITNNSDNHSLLINVSEQKSVQLKSQANDSQEALRANTIDNLKNDNWQMLSFSKISKDNKKQDNGLDKGNDESKDDNQNQQNSTNLAFRFIAKKGADIGNILHNVLEHSDFATADINGEILTEQMNKYKVVAAEDFDKLKNWLKECLEAPIPVIPTTYSKSLKSLDTLNQVEHDKDYFSLKNLANNQTLKEAEFYFPVLNEGLFRSKLLELLNEYRGTSDSTFVQGDIFGMLHGFIDLIFEYNGKFYVADYKSNYLGDKLEDYHPDAMQKKNEESMYDLQYLIYSVALDKYLAQNLPNYSFDTHFGGVYYFYLRGMKNGYGVYQAKPSQEIIIKLAKLFAGDK